nr:hypothetical protein BaRGS_010816 [Batillaria attramentaria]
MVYCEFHSALTIFSSIASFLWTTVTGISLYWAIVMNKPNTADKYWVHIWLICWVVPSAITVAALYMRVLGYDANLNQASWCWIDPGADLMVMWNFLTGKAWELMAYVLSVVLFGAVKLHLIRHKFRDVKFSKI